MKNLEYKKISFYDKFNSNELEKAFDYAKGYMCFLDAAKTEREAVKYTIAEAEKRGFIPYDFGDKLQKGGKYYYNNRGKNIFLFTVGSETLENGFRIAAAHIDSPRIDLKQCPLYDEGGMGFFKTHYYGGIRKYQWLALPLAIHGVVAKKEPIAPISVSNIQTIAIAPAISAILGLHTAKTPMVVAIPLPPLKRINTGKTCPNTAKKPHVTLATIETGNSVPTKQYLS